MNPKKFIEIIIERKKLLEEELIHLNRLIDIYENKGVYPIYNNNDKNEVAIIETKKSKRGSLTKKKKKCSYCGLQFQPKGNSQLYCSDHCHIKALEQRGKINNNKKREILVNKINKMTTGMSIISLKDNTEENKAPKNYKDLTINDKPTSQLIDEVNRGR